MRSRARWGAALLFAVAGWAIAGDEPKTYDIDWQPKWKAGQIVTVTLRKGK